MSRLTKSLDALSQLANVLILPHSGETDANESISGRSHRQKWRVRKTLINWLFFWQEDHCKAAFERDLERALNLVEKYYVKN